MGALIFQIEPDAGKIRQIEPDQVGLCRSLKVSINFVDSVTNPASVHLRRPIKNNETILWHVQEKEIAKLPLKSR
jgi:hypothetical protein